MRPQHDFVAERALAQHCAELLPATAAQFDPAESCASLARDFAAALPRQLASVVSGPKIKVVCGDAARSNTTAFLNRMAANMAHAVLDIPGGGALLVSIGHGAVLALTDRAYGGTGDTPETLPEVLPLSADLTLRQLETVWCDAWAQLFSDQSAPVINRRGGDLGRLDPFRGKAECVHVELSVEQEDQAPWVLTMAASLPDIQRAADVLSQPAGAAAEASHAPHDPLAEPFADMPLLARATLAEIALPLSRISALAPGDIIPLAIARAVPLRIGEATIARGTIGSLDDRIALQITTTF